MPLLPAEAYALKLAAELKVPPNSAQIPFYKEMATMLLMMLADADVGGLMTAPPGGGPVVVAPAVTPTGLKLV